VVFPKRQRYVQPVNTGWDIEIFQRMRPLLITSRKVHAPVFGHPEKGKRRVAMTGVTGGISGVLYNK